MGVYKTKSGKTYLTGKDRKSGVKTPVKPPAFKDQPKGSSTPAKLTSQQKFLLDQVNKNATTNKWSAERRADELGVVERRYGMKAGSLLLPSISNTLGTMKEGIASGTYSQDELDKAGKALGSASGLIGNLSVKDGRLAMAKAPGNVADINSQFPTFKLPEVPTEMGDIGLPSAGMAGMQQYISDYTKMLTEREQQFQKEQKSTLQTFMDSLTSPKEAREQAWDETGMDVKEHFAEQQKGIKEVETLQGQYNDIVAAKDQQIAQTNDKMASMNFINNQVQQIERNAAPQLQRVSAQINAKAAVLEAQQGNFAQAQSYVNQAVQDAVADYKFKADMYSEMYKLNEDSFNRVSSIYSDAFKNQMALAQMQYEEQRLDKERVGELLLKYPTAGIDIYKDSYTDALKKAGVVSGTSGDGMGLFDSQTISRAQQVLSGMASLSDFTTAEQAKIRDAIWGMDAKTAGYTGKYPRSYLPEALENEFNSLKMSVAGPGAGTASKKLWDMTADQQNSFGLNYLFSSGASMDDIAKFNDPNETAFRAWVLNEASK